LHGEPRIEKNRSIRTSGIPFTCGPLAHLRNRFYFGEVTFKGEILKGHPCGLVICCLFAELGLHCVEQVPVRNGRLFEAQGIVGR
jgi:hypothetical protein